jgi:hypothetical protein
MNQLDFALQLLMRDPTFMGLIERGIASDNYDAVLVRVQRARNAAELVFEELDPELEQDDARQVVLALNDVADAIKTFPVGDS